MPLAHRALHDQAQGRIENAPASVAAAVAAGYGIEIDLQPSADGGVMVFHDHDLDRLTAQRGPIAERATAELQDIQLTGSSDTIPTLPQVLAQVAGKVPLLIEVKDQDGALGEAETGFEEDIARDLAPYSGPVALMSFNPHIVTRFRQLAPDIPRGLVTDDFTGRYWADVPKGRQRHLTEIADFDNSGASFISHNRRDLDSDAVAAIKARGVPILTWTIRSEAEEARARKIADNITFEGYRPPFG